MKLCSKLPLDKPFAHAIEFESLMQIILEGLIEKSTFMQHQNQNGIGDKIMAWSDACEEETRKSLHSHLLFWIAGFACYGGSFPIMQQLKEFIMQVIFPSYK